ncbi:hypothetical protein ANN_03736 [Periplaneta americana]|uniref:Uncharacterized protein n=1 Tax=Periplaneta americana TaxID=6978 RepID=A0ABQ8TZR2_PERAM|nr:hypothetical protein ANN_03736 [Periplaneta americana]
MARRMMGLIFKDDSFVLEGDFLLRRASGFPFCDFYLWGKLKQKVCVNNPHTLDELENEIRRVTKNKNSIVMAMLIEFLEKSRVFSSIRHFFPVRGHSYLALDGVFGRIKKDLRKRESILSPQ